MHQKTLFKLSNLNNLTHQKIDKAFENTLLRAPFFQSRTLLEYDVSIFNVDNFDVCPYQRVYGLTNLVNRTQNHFALQLRVLGNLLDGSDADSLQLNATSELLTAVRIFLKFKKEGKQYSSENGNTSLHDAILYCPTYKDALTALLIQNGADIEIKNDNNQTAPFLYIERYLPSHEALDKCKKAILDLCEPHEHMMLFIYAVIQDENSEIAFEYLKFVELYKLHNIYPRLFTYSIPDDDECYTILHNAALFHSEKIVQFILNLGANPDVLDSWKYKPIHRAVIQAKTGEPEDLEISLKIIALLIVSSLKWSQPTDQILNAHDYVDALLELDLTKHELKLSVCAYLSELIQDDACNYRNLCKILEAKLSILEHKEIQKITPHAKGTNGVIGKGVIKRSQGMPESVAIKHNIYPHQAPMARLEEALLSNLNHRNIIRYICHIERSDISGFVMPFANQGTLGDVIMNGNIELPEKYLCSLIKQINAGLSYIHRHKLVHLDIKLGNILMHNGIPLITDFGNATLQDDTRPYLVTTVTHRSPEGFDLKTPYHSSRDIFSFGVVIGEIMTKQYAWTELWRLVKKKKEFSSLVDKAIAKGERTNFNNTKLPLMFKNLIDSCVAESADTRPNCEEIDIALDEISHSYGSQCK